MPVTIDWATKVINVPQNYLTYIGGSLYELDVNQFRLDLKAIEASEDGMPFEDTHRHNTEVTLAGITLARTVEIINGYTVTFESVGSPYRVRCVGANHNISDVQNLNEVSLIIGNTAGLIVKSIGSGLSQEEHDALIYVRAAIEDIGESVSDMSDVVDQIAEINQLLVMFVKNKRYLEKVGNTWYLVIRNDDDTADILRKAIKDKNGNDIDDIKAGIIAQELKSSV